jgi:hypothetical protein
MGIGIVEIVLIVVVSLVATVVPLALVGFLVFRLMKGSAERQKLLQTGVPATAQVIAVQQTGTYVNNQPEVMATLMVQRAGAPPYQVNTTMILSLLEVPRLQPGASVAVKIDPQDAQKVAIDLSQAPAMPGMVPAMGAMGFAPQQPAFGAQPAAYGAPPVGPATMCPSCRQPVAQGHPFCSHCGTRLG